MQVFLGYLFLYLVFVSFYFEKFGVSARTTTITDADSSSPQIQFNGQYPPINPSCKALPIAKETWNQLKLNDHLKQFPGGDKMNLVQYATKLNMTNFVCGIGGACHAGQPCYPLETPDWYILFAVQQWNSYMNVYYEAVGYGIAIVQSSLNALIASLFPASDTTAIRNVKANLGIQASLSQVTGTVMMDVMLAFGSTSGPWFALFDFLNFIMTAAQGVAAFAIQEPPAPLQDGFFQWSNTAYYLSKYEEVIHKQIAEEGKKRIAAGISTNQGIFGVVKDGNFIEPENFPSLPDLEEQIRKLTSALGLNMLLHSINAFITVGSDPCTDKGKNGAWPEGTHLSWCDKPDGTMHNIVIAKDGKTYNEINNAALINDYFGIGTELIVTSSIKCQNMNKGWNYVPWSQDKGALPKAPDSDCVFNLPVCYTQDGDVHKKIHKKKWTTARACKHAGLPLE
ncbi:hypothetical protein PTTG_25269 [Puccinia triticina 1-1 BBBD Race 1]|uniref:DUF7872 domain-containing protein n=2 Tax=Puccinia triticina TaxID=208348 RepID=A0A180H552_PUCT1|nr:uncharacterized protein PtA15_2A533 [Puccinia triticina]OAV99719.1 hypothetical protein PTTG_25269 [Puccinia triticina 1-1 BBBD Race 1]WAQ82216.1 hypothetical protein PtA15_2A533 [Puccinia triticina]WAR53071.1 hypothetical protein PtB15_2B501 [Puccinia triticina]